MTRLSMITVNLLESDFIKHEMQTNKRLLFLSAWLVSFSYTELRTTHTAEWLTLV